MTAFPHTEVRCDGAGFPGAPRCDAMILQPGRASHVRAVARRDYGWQTLPGRVDRCPACVRAARAHAAGRPS